MIVVQRCRQELRYAAIPDLTPDAQLYWVHEHLHTGFCSPPTTSLDREFLLLDPQEEIPTQEVSEQCELLGAKPADIWGLFSFARFTPIGQAHNVVALLTIHDVRFSPFIDEHEGRRKIYFERRDYPWPKGFRFLAIK